MEQRDLLRQLEKEENLTLYHILILASVYAKQMPVCSARILHTQERAYRTLLDLETRGLVIATDKALKWELWTEDLIGKNRMIRSFRTMHNAKDFLTRNPDVK